MNPRLFVTLMVVATVWILLRSEILAQSLVLALSCGFLATLSLRPVVIWIHEGMDTLPIMEAYSLGHLFVYLLPVLYGHISVTEYSVEDRIKAVHVVCMFLFSAQFVFNEVRHLAKGSFHFRSSFLDRVIAGGQEPAPFFVLLSLWWFVVVARQLHLMGWLGSAFQPVWTLASAAGLISISFLFLLLGRRELKSGFRFGLLLMVGSGVALDFTSGFLVGGTWNLMVAILGYTMGRKRVPFIPVMMCFVLISILHAGKAEMRARYWERGTNWSSKRLNPVEVYGFWLSAGCANVFRTSASEPSRSHSVFHRGAVVHLVLRAVSQTPKHLPFLGGTTYLQTPQLLIPRFFWPSKPRGTLPTETLAIYYGVNSKEGVNHTSVGMGQIAEAWANFGWFGVVIVGAFFGVLFAIPCQLAAGRAEYQVGFIMGVFFLSSARNFESTLGPLLVQLVQGLVVALPLLFLLSEPQRLRRRLPFAHRRVSASRPTANET